MRNHKTDFRFPVAFVNGMNPALLYRPSAMDKLQDKLDPIDLENEISISKQPSGDWAQDLLSKIHHCCYSCSIFCVPMTLMGYGTHT